MPERAAPGLFDSHVDSYDDDCMRGLKLTGESREYFARGRLELLQAWWKRTRRPEPETVIDYGCGTGEGTALLAEFFPYSSIIGLDPSEPSVELAATRHESDRVRFRRLEPGDSRPHAQLVHINGVIHHVEPSDRPRLMEDIRARLDDSGVLALFENNPLNPGTRMVMARIPFDRDAVPVLPWKATEMLRRGGFTIERQGYLFYFPRLLSALRPLESWLVRLPFGAQYGVFAVRT